MERVEFRSRRGNRLVGILHPPRAGDARSPGVILCHGMESTKDGIKHQRLGTDLSSQGLWVLRFDFSYVGESEGEFADLTFRGEVEDVAGAWAFLRERTRGPVGLLGSSMGGAVALLFAAEEREVAALATIAAVGHPGRSLGELRPAELDQWRREGTWSLGGVRLRKSFLEDVETLDVIDACGRVRCPAFVAHGDADRVVPVSDAHEIVEALASERRQKKIYPGADHRFSKPDDLEELLGDCTTWLVAHLRAEPAA